MKRPLLGILAVFCLQIGFIGYNAIVPADGSPVSVEEIATAREPLPELSDLDLASIDEESLSSLTNEIEPALTQRRYRVGSRPASARPQGVRVFQTDFKSVSITVPKVSPYTFAVREPSVRTEYPSTMVSDRQNASYDVRTLERRKKRGFLSKSLAVVKKPYDWLKAVGSKLK